MNVKIPKIYYPAFVVFLTLSIFAIIAFYQARVTTRDKREDLFQSKAKGVYNAVNSRMIDYVQILKGCQGLFYGSDSITAQDWKVYIENLNIDNVYPGIQGIAYAPFTPAADKARLENSIRQSGFPKFRVQPAVKNNFLVPIIYIEPFTDRNLRAFGYDMYSDMVRREAIDRALISGEASLTRKVTLIQETADNIQPGFLLYLPVYKNPGQNGDLEFRIKNTKGFVFYPFRAYDMMKTISSRFDDLKIKIYDGDTPNQFNLLFDSEIGKGMENQKKKPSDELISNQKLKLAGTTWNIIISSKDTNDFSISKMQPIMILISGLLISIFFYFMILNIYKRNERIGLELESSKQLDHKKDEFIGIASHELKTPLTSIKAYIQLLERCDLSDQAQNFVAKASVNVTKLNNLIGDLLDVSKIESGQLALNYAPFELKQMVSECIENVQHMYGSHKIVIQNPIQEVIIDGDLIRLEQAMVNLLVNAIKYSPGADAVYLRTEQINSNIKISITDVGIGISKANQEKIFNRFFRAKELSPVLSGLGMGLYISAEIVKRHNGKIGVISEPGKGSTFYIVLPLNSLN